MHKEDEMTRWLFLLLAGVAVWTWAVPPAAAQVTITVAQSASHGSYLTDVVGRPLYLFTADKQGTGEGKAESHCYEACAVAWPPVLTEGQPQAGPQAREALLGTIQRRDGLTQATYNGWPLYYYAQDQPQGQPTGQDAHGFGGEWYLIQPEGSKAAEKK
jgi:predicted lipoprotein with Yx(FWY)xxD motif